MNEFEPAFYDPTCAQGGLGCGAGGNSLCRFCGWVENFKSIIKPKYLINLIDSQFSLHVQLQQYLLQELQQQLQQQQPQQQPLVLELHNQQQLVLVQHLLDHQLQPVLFKAF